MTTPDAYGSTYARHMFEPHHPDPDIHIACRWCGRIASDAEHHYQEGEIPMTHREDLAAALQITDATTWTWQALLNEVRNRGHHPVKPPVATPAQLLRNAALLLSDDGLVPVLMSYAEQIEEREKNEERRRAVTAVLANVGGLRPSEKLIDAILEAVLDGD